LLFARRFFTQALTAIVTFGEGAQRRPIHGNLPKISCGRG
jgi:hypothetical protein